MQTTNLEDLRAKLETAAGVKLGDITLGVDILIETASASKEDADKIATLLRAERSDKARVLVEHDSDLGYFVVVRTGDLT